MILLDFSSIAMSSIFPRIDDYDEDKDLIRHTMLNIIRKYNVDYRDKYGETIVCFDAGNSWRRQNLHHIKQIDVKIVIIACTIGMVSSIWSTR